MASLPVYLSNIKSSGIYTYEFDRSQIVTTTTSTIRLLIGFSKVGPFNTPVYCQDNAFFTSVFGKRDKQLEKKGSYFHLSAETMLEVSPIIVLNLLALDDTLDKTEFISFSTSANQPNQKTGFAPLSGNFNVSKFWKLENKKSLQNIDNQDGYSKSLLNFVNIGRKTISVIVTQDKIQGLDITANNWFGEADVPEFMDGSDLINDYCVRVNVLKGDYTDFEKLSVDPILGDYFDSNGVKKIYTDTNGNTQDGLVALLQNPNVVSLGQYTGVLIPDFQDAEGNDLYIQDIINLETSFTGLYCSVNEDLFDGSTLLSGTVIDLLGGSIDGATNLNKINYLSYLGNISEDLTYPAIDYIDNQKSFGVNTFGNYTNGSYTGSANAQVKLTDTTSDKFDTIIVYSPSSTDVSAPSGTNVFASHSEWLDWALSLKENESFISCSSTGTTTLALVKDISLSSDKISIQIYPTNEDQTETLFFEGGLFDMNNDLDIDIISTLNIQTLDGGNYLFTSTTPAGIDFKEGTLSSGDTVKVTGGAFEKFTVLTKVANGSIGDDLNGLLSGNKLSHGISYFILDAENPADTLTMEIKSKAGSINKSFTVTKINDYQFTYSVANGSLYNLGDIQPTDFLVRSFDDGVTKTKFDPRTGNTRYTRIESVKEDSGMVIVKTIDPVYFGPDNDTVERYKSVQNFVTNYNIHGLDGFTMRDAQIPNGTTQRQNEILKVLTDTGLYATLTDKEAITFRYVIDSFDGAIEPNTKNILSSLCKNRQFAFAILNAPSVRQFEESTNPLFKFNSRSNYSPLYVPQGGNQDLNPSNTFSLPSLNQGSNYCGFFHPYLVLREGPSSKLVPPSAYISNNFIEKYRAGKPYDIIAGPRRGVVSGNNIVGVEYIYDRAGLDAVEPFGLNVIVPSRGFGNVINANQTAQQNIKSALSSIHVRELAIYIEENVEQILKNYRWEFNTVQVRLEIKTLVDGFLSQILNNGGLYDYQTIMNSQNNTPEVIDNDFAIIDLAIEPVRGMGKIVQRVTILKTGGIASGGFSIQ